MKKNFFKKKLASALALALVVASVSPVSASAATAAKIVDKGASTPTAILYVDKVAYGKSAVNFDLSKTYAGTTYTWTVSDSKKATIGAKTGYVVAKAPGVVTVKVAAKTKAGKTTTFTTKVTIRKRATAVAAGEDVALKVGETKTQAAVVTPSNSTDAVKYVSDKPEVATVDAKTGAVTAVKTGEATITVYAKAASAAPDSSQYNVSDSYKVTVTNAITKVAAVSPKKLAVTFAESLTGTTYTKDNFTVLTSDTSTKNYVQSIATSTDGKTVTLTFYSELTSGKTYDVTATFGTLVLKGSTPFVKGAVAKIVGTNQVVLADASGSNAQAIAYTVYDENGLDITDSTTVYFESNVTVNNGKVSLANGVLAYVTVVYVNPTTGAQIKSNTFTVTGSNSVATAASAYTVKDTAITTSNWPTAPVTSLAKNAVGPFYAYVKTVDQYGNATVYGGVTPNSSIAFESLDPSIFVLDKTTGKITPIAAGTAQFKFTVGNVSQIYSLTITDSLKSSSLVINSTSVLKASVTNPTVNFAEIYIDLLDQLGNKYNTDTTSDDLTAKLIDGDNIVSATSGGVGITTATTGLAVNAGTAVGDGFKVYAKNPGTAVFKITSENSSIPYITVVVTVYNSDVVITDYAIKGVTDLDLDYTAQGTIGNSPISVEPVNANGFVVDNAAAVSGASIKMVKPDGTSVNNVTAITALGNVDQVGTYTLYALLGTATLKTVTFKVIDSAVQPAVYLKVNSIAAATGTITASTLLNSTNVNLDGAVITGIKFSTGDGTVVAPVTTYVSSFTKGSGTVVLYNVQLEVTKNGRTFYITTGVNLTLTN